MRRGNFIENKDIMEQWKLWKDSSEDLDKRTIPDKLVEQMYLIATHLLEHSRFALYPSHEKDDMRQEGVLKCMKNLKNFNPDKGNIFSYFTRCCWTAFIVHLAEYYKNINQKRQLVLETLNTMDERQLNSVNYLKQLMADLQEDVAEYEK